MAVVIVPVEASNCRKPGDRHPENGKRKLRHATEERDASDRDHHARQQKPGPPARADGAHHEGTTRHLAAARVSRGARLGPLCPQVDPVARGHLASDELSALDLPLIASP